MREIKFRGYAVEEMINSQWLYGFGVMDVDYVDGTNEYHLHTMRGTYEVVPESIGQYTGLKDKNDTEIYKGDILKVEPENREHYPSDSLFWVNTNVSMWGLEFDWQHISGYECSTHIVEYDYDEYENVTQLKNVEVIGNIYENPELLD